MARETNDLHSGTAALALVHVHLTETLQAAGAALDHFVQNWQQRDGLENFIQHLHSLRGIYSLLELPAAEDFCHEALHSVQELHFSPDAETLQKVEQLSYGCALLVRYTDFIAGKRCDLPELLMPAINGLRLLRRLPALPDSHYLELRRPGERFGEASEFAQVDPSGRTQALFQLGLLHVLTRHDPQPGLNLLRRTAQSVMHQLPASHADHPVWLLTSALVHTLGGSLSVSEARRRLLSRVERHAAARRRADAELHPLHVENALLRDLFYHVGLADTLPAACRALASAWQVNLRPVSEAELTDALAQIAAPSEATYRAVLDQVREDVAALLIGLQHQQVASPGDETDCGALAAGLRRFGHTLLLVEQFTLAQELLQTADQLAGTQPEVVAICHGNVQAAINTLAKLKLNLDSRLLAPRVASELALTPAYAASLDEQHAATLIDLRHYLQDVMASVETYLATDGQRSQIRHVPDTLQRICQGLSYLQHEPWAQSLQICRALIEHALAPTTLRSLPARALTVFADVLSAVDYGCECELAGLPVPAKVQSLIADATLEVRAQLRAA